MDVLANREREHYDVYADDELTFNFFNSLLHTIFFDRYLKFIPDVYFENKVVVDLCCGCSRLLRYALFKGCTKAIGIDVSYRMLFKGVKERLVWVYNQKLPYQEAISFIQGDMEHIPLKGGVADLVCIVSALHHIADKAAFFDAVRKLLKPGGIFIIRDPNGEHYLRVLGNKVGKKWGTLSDDEAAVGFPTVANLLAHKGFAVKKVVFFNLAGEVNSHISEIVYQKVRLLGMLQLILNIIFYPLEYYLDRTLFKIFPNLAWSFFVIAQKKE